MNKKDLQGRFERVFGKSATDRIFAGRVGTLELRSMGVSVPTLNQLRAFGLVARGNMVVDNSFDGLLARGFQSEEINRIAEMGGNIETGDIRPAWLKEKDEEGENYE